MNKVIDAISQQHSLMSKSDLKEIREASPETISVTYWDQDNYIDDEFAKMELKGETADVVRRAFGVTDSTLPVFLTESIMHVGYSEYTDEINHDFEVSCGYHHKTFSEDYGDLAPLAQFAQWCTENA